MEKITTIQLAKKTKERLDALKIHARETYNELILRVVNNSPTNKESRESLIETIEVLSDPDMMKGIAEALQEKKKGKSFEELEKELRL